MAIIIVPSASLAILSGGERFGSTVNYPLGFGGTEAVGESTAEHVRARHVKESLLRKEETMTPHHVKTIDSPIVLLFSCL